MSNDKNKSDSDPNFLAVNISEIGIPLPPLVPTTEAAQSKTPYDNVLAIQESLLNALEWIARDGADRDDCEKARPHLERARVLVDAAKQNQENT